MSFCKKTSVRFVLPFTVCLLLVPVWGMGQEPSPEPGATLFPGGALVSYNSVLTYRTSADRSTTPDASLQPTFVHRIPLTFAWAFRRDWQLTTIVPFAVNKKKVDSADATDSVGGGGIGDVTLLVKHRFLRVDSERGTTQASISAGSKFPTGLTGLRDRSGELLPIQLQPGSGSTDLFVRFNGTYTGVLNIRRLVFDASFSYLARTRGSQETELGDIAESRFWLSYRPFQARTVGTEWFIGPSATWVHRGQDDRSGKVVPRTGGDEVFVGVTSYFSPKGGLIFWGSVEFPVADDFNGARLESDLRLNFGVTRQFVLDF